MFDMDAPHLPTRRHFWRWFFAVAWAAGAGEVTTRAVVKGFEPAVGFWGAAAAGMVAAAAVIPLVALAASRVLSLAWRPVVAMGLAVGLALGSAGQLREQDLVGFWGAALTAGLVAALVVQTASWLMKSRRRGDSNVG